ncbi:isocitrate/isopropylmalate dehydrogenase family protein [bacterium]|nr:isocitrate/isopropylmalate dehydrogenase family protein [bacterium]
MKHRITLFKGDGIGPEITNELKRVFKALNLDIEYDEFLIGEDAYQKYGVLIPNDAIESIKKNKVALKAPVTTPIGKGFKSVNVTLRNIFDLYVNFRPAKSMPGTLSKYDNIDIITFRENTEDLYIGDEYEIEDGYIAKKKITRTNSERIIRYAFEYALKNNRKKVTCIHKANILKKSDGLFLDTFNAIKSEYPTIESDDKIIDNMCMQLVMDPKKFDCLVAPNLYGDIVTDLIAGLIGGLGMAPAANIGKDIAIFEAVHGSAPDIKNMAIANPTAFFLSSALMLDYIGEKESANKLKNAIEETLKEGLYLTRDLGGNAKTYEYTDRVISKL